MTDILTNASEDSAPEEAPVEKPLIVDMLHVEWKKFADGIPQIDDQLNTDGGAAALGRAAIETLDPNNAENVTSAVERMLAGHEPQQLLGIVTLIRRTLRSVEAQVKAYVDANKTETPDLPDTVVQELRAKRKELVQSANALRLAVDKSAPGWSAQNLDAEFPEFTNLRGGGPRVSAPRLKGSYVWVVDGEGVDGDRIGDVAKVVGVGAVALKIALKDHMEALGIPFDFADPPQSFSWPYIHGDVNDPDGHIEYRISATRRESDTGDDDDLEDDGTYDEPDTDETDNLFADNV